MPPRNPTKHRRRRLWLPALLLMLFLLGYGIAMTVVAFTPSSVSAAGSTSAYSLGAAQNDVVVSGSGTFAVTGSNAHILSGNTTENALTGTPVYAPGASDLGSVGLAAAVSAVTSLYNTLFALSGIPITTTLEAQDVGYGPGIYGPGVYKAAAAFNMTATRTITLNGVGDYVFIAGGVGAITFGANDTILLTGGAVASRVYWVAGGAISTGALDTLVGNFMPGGSAAITVGDGNTIQGRLLSRIGVSVNGSAASAYSLPT